MRLLSVGDDKIYPSNHSILRQGLMPDE